MAGISLLELLNDYYEKRNISFAMPGHKNGRGIPEPLKSGYFKYDVTELAQTESMHEPGDVLRKILDDTARFYKADESFILVNGSSSGIFTMLMSCCAPGDKIITNRGCHISVINACITLGIEPVFVREKAVAGLNIPAPAEVADIESLLDMHDVSAVIITAPTYYGLEADIEETAAAVHRRGIPLLVDEAHGAHFMANQEIFPKTAIMCGADMCVQSAHKTLNAGNQTAFLHVKSGLISLDRVRRCFGFFQTTSPSYPLIASAELARRELETKGREEWTELHGRCMQLRRELGDIMTIPDRSWCKKNNIYDMDECKLILNVSGYDMTGYEFSEILRENYKIDVETVDELQAVLLPTPSNSEADFAALKKAVTEIFAGRKRGRGKMMPAFDAKTLDTAAAMTPSMAFYSESRFVPLEGSAGHISKNSVIPYPPGIAVLAAGEYITDGIISYIKCLLENNMKVIGICDKMIEVII